MMVMLFPPNLGSEPSPKKNKPQRIRHSEHPQPEPAEWDFYKKNRDEPHPADNPDNCGDNEYPDNPPDNVLLHGIFILTGQDRAIVQTYPLHDTE